ncbi:MAG TPA: zinc ribbon domain-containing protein [Candidatus Marinimicrobia bacterium]|nr:zinc ribbon domain-containing protein [Candidatus Neomarinimicrobiota bacterium]HIN02575.1 zinc ribbon domain-containing protein [Candidatus Neomarinimicrobiota bacterium]
MPTYDYICAECGDRFEHFQSMTSAALTQKPNCEEEKCRVKRVVSGGTGLIFKGSGFYQTDYKNNANPDKPKKETKEKPKTEPIKKEGKTAE